MMIETVMAGNERDGMLSLKGIMSFQVAADSPHSPPRRGVSQLSCGQTITVRNFPLLGSGPILSRIWPKKSDTAAVSVGRVPSGACFGEPVEEFDPRPVRNNIGDAQPWFVL